MIFRIVSIALSAGAVWAIWFGFENLKVLRGTPLWEFRYFGLMLATFLGLSALEWGLDLAKRKLSRD